jgi:hypothetical protein
MLLLIGGAMTVEAYASDGTSGLTADQTIACIRAALTAQPGLINEVDVDDKRGQRLCKVEIMAENGRRDGLHVDVATSRVVKIQKD